MGNLKLSVLAETLQASEIVRLGANIKEKMKQGAKIYNYTIGDFDSSIFPIPAELEAEIIEAYKNGFSTGCDTTVARLGPISSPSLPRLWQAAHARR